MDLSSIRVHFVGIGGIGMSGIAEVMHGMGSSISGSDLSPNDNTRHLETLGIRIFQGHHRKNLPEVDVVVVSSAVAGDNPEVLEAKNRGIQVIQRARMLSALMKNRIGLAVSGSHGKTTTSSLLAEVLINAGLDPTLVVGGRLCSLGTNARVGRGPHLVAEADESDGSFLMLEPRHVIITNIDPEHLDHYKNLEALRQSFVDFTGRIPEDGLVVACVDNPGVRSVLPAIQRKIVTYGFSEEADYHMSTVLYQGSQVSFGLRRNGDDLGRIELRMQGRHNVQNATAVVAMAHELGIGEEIIKQTFIKFKGIERRLTLCGQTAGISVFDDYGHHPDEIKTTLEGAACAWGRRLVVIFQPHRYTRTRDLADAFAPAFDRADALVLMDIYSAGDSPIEGVSSKILLDGIRESGHRNVLYIPDREQVLEWLMQNVRESDVVITMGAGDVWQVGKEFLKRMSIEEAGEEKQ